MGKRYLLISAVLTLLLLGTQSLFATGGNKLGTAGAPELLIPMGARNVAMAGANISSITNADAIYWNPAGVAEVTNMDASFTYISYFADMSISYFSLAVDAGDIGAFGVGLQALDIGNIEVTTLDTPEGTGENISPDYLTATVTYSKKFTDRINFGVNTKVISETIGNMSATAFAWDFGLQYKSSSNIDFGITLKNVGTKLKFSGTGIEFDSRIPDSEPGSTTRKTNLDMAEHELPASFNIGFSYHYDINEQQNLTFVGQFENSSFAIDKIIGGLEYSFNNMLYLRGGYSLAMFEDDLPSGLDESQYGLHLGFGVNLDIGGNSVYVNYAYRPMEDFDPNSYFTVGFEL